MEKYFETFYMGYANYFMYVLNEILHPSWHNYFYWLIAISFLFGHWKLFSLAKTTGCNPT